MTNSTPKTLTIELVYYTAEEAVQLLKKIHKNNVNMIGSKILISGNSYMKTKLLFEKPLVEPDIRIINGRQCEVYQSSMNV